MKKKIVFTGGGTLGHVMPNLYLIDELRDQDWDITYIGSSGIERDKIRGHGVNFVEIPAVKLVRGKIWRNLKIPFVLIRAISRCKKELKRLNPDVVFSKGGYVSLPVCVAARRLKIPIIAHESDYSFGLANKLILKLCNKMCVNFSHLEKKSEKIVYTGPIFSRRFDSVDGVDIHMDKSKPTLLIVCGSLGSKAINDLIYASLSGILARFNVIHVTGKGDKRYPSYDNYMAYETAEDMVGLYNVADFVLGRSGAGVTAECFYKQLPMILIPLEKASRGDQLQNARYYEKLGVAKILHEEILDPQKLLQEIVMFSDNISIYREAYKKCDKTNGRLIVLDLINAYVEKKK